MTSTELATEIKNISEPVVIPTTKSGAILIGAKELKGKQYVDIRTHYEKDGEWLPTTKGIWIPLGNAANVVSSLQDVLKDLRQKSLDEAAAALDK
jgi:hypothetical protein